jgi:hypothetical protein
MNNLDEKWRKRFKNNPHFDFLPVLVDRDFYHGAYPIVVNGVFDDAPYRSVPVCSAPSQCNRFLSQKKRNRTKFVDVVRPGCFLLTVQRRLSVKALDYQQIRSHLNVVDGMLDETAIN